MPKGSKRKQHLIAARQAKASLNKRRAELHYNGVTVSDGDVNPSDDLVYDGGSRKAKKSSVQKVMANPSWYCL